MPTENNLPTERLNALEAEIKSIREKALPLIWKAITIVSTLILGVVSFYVFYYAPMQIDNHILSKQLEEQNKNPNMSKELEALGKTIDSLDKRLTENVSRLDGTITRLDERVNNYLLGIAQSRPKTHHALRRALAVRHRQLRNSLPVARELLQRAKEQGTLLSYAEIREAARATLPLLHKEQKGTDVRQEILNTLAQLAEYKTFVDSKVFTQQSSGTDFCRNGEGTLGGIPLQDAVFVNCTIRYNGGDVILRNVRYINCKFVMADEPDGEKFLMALLLSDKPTINVGSLKLPGGSSSSE